MKKILVVIVLIIFTGAISAWWIFNEQFSDTKHIKADYRLTSAALIREFEAGDSIANKKYSNKIIAVEGVIKEIEKADSLINVKFIDDSSGGYIIFAFQPKYLREANQVRVGDSVTIKGSCAGGAYSQIMESEYITFARCTLDNKK